MSSVPSEVPSEVLEDVLQPLDRWTLDAVQFTSRRFLRLIVDRMSDVCPRQIKAASFKAPNEENVDATSSIQVVGRPERNISNANKDTGHLFAEFVQALQSSCVVCLTFERLVFTPALVTLTIETPIFVNHLSVNGGSCAELTPTQFREMLLHFSPSNLRISSCYVRACQISDELMRALIQHRVQCIAFPDMVPVDGGVFDVTDDAVIDFCMQPDQDGDASKQRPFGELYLYNGSFTKGLFKRLLEASSVSVRTQPLRIIVSPLRFEDEDLRDFSQHLSYRHRGYPFEQRVYDFLGEQHGAGARIHLQIVLLSDKSLEINRGRRPDSFFREPHE